MNNCTVSAPYVKPNRVAPKIPAATKNKSTTAGSSAKQLPAPASNFNGRAVTPVFGQSPSLVLVKTLFQPKKTAADKPASSRQKVSAADLNLLTESLKAYENIDNKKLAPHISPILQTVICLTKGFSLDKIPPLWRARLQAIGPSILPKHMTEKMRLKGALASSDLERLSLCFPNLKVTANKEKYFKIFNF